LKKEKKKHDRNITDDEILPKEFASNELFLEKWEMSEFKIDDTDVISQLGLSCVPRTWGYTVE
jgi:hypothetical protein